MADDGAYILPELPGLPPKDMAGPFSWCNWVIGKQVLVGAFPATLDDQETYQILGTFLGLGITTFVCLQAEFRLEEREADWRNGLGLRPYVHDATAILSAMLAAGDPRIKQKKLDFLHLPIIDGTITTDSAVERLEEDVRQRILKGEGVYIHCWGGHGRTGTLVALLLSSLYGINAHVALEYTQALHDSRGNPQGVRSPQTRIQRDQVRRIISYRAQEAMRAPAPEAYRRSSTFSLDDLVHVPAASTSSSQGHEQPSSEPEETKPRPTSRRAPPVRAIHQRSTPSTYGTVRASKPPSAKETVPFWMAQQGRKAGVAAGSREGPSDLIPAGNPASEPGPPQPAAEGPPPSQPRKPPSRPGSGRASAPAAPAAVGLAAGLGIHSRPSSGAGGAAWPGGGGSAWGVERPATAREGNRSLPALLQAAHLASDSEPAPSRWLDHPQDPARPAAKGRGRSFVDTLAAAVRSGFSASRAQQAPWPGSTAPSGAPGSLSAAKGTPRKILKTEPSTPQTARSSATSVGATSRLATPRRPQPPWIPAAALRPQTATPNKPHQGSTRRPGSAQSNRSALSLALHRAYGELNGSHASSGSGGSALNTRYSQSPRSPRTAASIKAPECTPEQRALSISGTRPFVRNGQKE